MGRAFRPNVAARSVSVWLLIMGLETGHGLLRRLVLPEDPGLLAENLAVLIGCAIVVGASYLCRGWLGLRTAGQAAVTGVGWVILTLAFEMGLGRLTGVPWSRMISEYDLSQGRLMAVGLLVMGLAPWLTRKQDRLRPS